MVKKHIFPIVISLLVIILVIVSFYMLWVHVPYYNYHHQLDEIRNEICETNHYEYMDYFNEHRGKEKYYVLKVKIDHILSYVAYDKDLKLVDIYQGNVVDEKIVQDAILKKYKDEVTQEDVQSLDIGYENDRFVYYVKVQREDYLLYLYYDISNGEFVKTYRINANES